MQPKSEVVYIFMESALQQGDILLSRDNTAKRSSFIRTVTKSPYSHAAICHRTTEFLEAISTGVSRINVLRFFVEDMSCIAIMRLRTDYPKHTELAAHAADEATLYLGNDYWMLGALTATLTNTSRRKRNSVFCSHLVASAYAAAGITLVKGKSAAKITPADIARSPILENVTNSIMKPVKHDTEYLWGIPFEYDLSYTPHRIEICTSTNVRDYVNAWLRGRGLPEQQNFYQLLNFLRDFPDETIRREIDEICCSGLKKEGYLELLAQVFPPDHPTFHLSSLLRRMLVDGRVTDHEKQALRERYNSVYAEQLQDMKEKSYLREWYENAWLYRRLETFHLLTDNQSQVCDVSDKFLRETKECLRLLGENVASWTVIY